MTLRHIRREPKLGFWARLLGRQPAMRTYCGAPITSRDFTAVPREWAPFLAEDTCLACYGIATSTSKQRAAEIRRAVDSPN